MFCHSFKYQYFKSINIFAILIPATRLPMLNGMIYIVRPLMQPGKSVWIFLLSSEGEIQLPSLPWTPSAASGMVVILLGVEMNVRDSTRATSFGSVRAKKQLSYFGNGMRTPASTSYKDTFPLANYLCMWVGLRLVVPKWQIMN